MPKPNCTEREEPQKIEFGRLGRRAVEGRFDGGSMTSDGGVMLLGEVDRKLGLLEAAAHCIADPRNPLLIKHQVRDMLRQRVYGLAQGWEDLNDHTALRLDMAMQTAVGVDHEVASAPTLCRLEKWADRASAWRLHGLLIDQFIASFKSAPAELVLDFDATDNPLYGQQEASFFNAHYDSYCYLPLYVFSGQQLLCAYLRPSDVEGAHHAAAILKLLVKRLRQAWPKVRIIFRGDSGFCRQRIINWCERSGVHYVVGLARNARLHRIVEYAELALQEQYDKTGVKQRLIDEFSYAAQSWPHERRVITRLEWGNKAPTRASSSPTSMARRNGCTTRCTASAARRRTASRRRRSDCSPRARVARCCAATSCACCWPRSAMCSSSGCARWHCKARRWQWRRSTPCA
jgi:hypothetical protein